MDRDLDGDQLRDHISFRYTGGAHCCYKMAIKLASLRDTLKFPFEMDGGFTYGIVDGSQPDRFEIDDYDQDGLPEIFMEISTYNGQTYPIEKKWNHRYGITSHHLIFAYQKGKLKLLDFDPLLHKKKRKKNWVERKIEMDNALYFLPKTTWTTHSKFVLTLPNLPSMPK